MLGSARGHGRSRDHRRSEARRVVARRGKADAGDDRGRGEPRGHTERALSRHRRAKLLRLLDHPVDGSTGKAPVVLLARISRRLTNELLFDDPLLEPDV